MCFFEQKKMSKALIIYRFHLVEIQGRSWYVHFGKPTFQTIIGKT